MSPTPCNSLSRHAHPVAQISNLLYRRLEVCKMPARGIVLVESTSRTVPDLRRLEICDTADSKSALRGWANSVAGLAALTLSRKLRIALLTFSAVLALLSSAQFSPAAEQD